ncbi:MAG: hypothetical protein ACQEWV_06965 [Bacillota bacterium]
MSQVIKIHHLSIEIEVDGGINADTARLIVESGANVLIDGSAIYNQSDQKVSIKIFKRTL